MKPVQELQIRQVEISAGFWAPRLDINAQAAILHQWDQLENSACIDNFRLVAEGKPGFREGRFFADSDAYKWLDAACRVYVSHPSADLKERIDGLIALIGATQTKDGYIYTYNQFHFPEVRWTNLQIEHELYCHGHLIEAAVSHFQATGERALLDIAEKAAGLLVRVFGDAGPEGTGGHEEIELALIKLYRATDQERYLDLAEHFIEQRGRTHPFAPLIYRENRDVNRRSAWIRRQRESYLADYPEYGSFQLPAGNTAKKPRFIGLRRYLSALTGKYFQQHHPVRQQTIPVGHAVRFAYLETAVAMLHRERGDETLLAALQQAWDHMVCRRMYVTGGIGSLPAIEGFGRDYELDAEIAYAETCAALGCMFWNWEMALVTGRARYADLFEWQLYNASGVGMGVDGTSYLYNNPLACRGGVTRQAWYHVPCCPSNLSRTWAAVGGYIYSHTDDGLWVHQYIGNATETDLNVPVRIEMASGLPWEGQVRLQVSPAFPSTFTLHLRVPSWADGFRLLVNGEPVQTAPAPGNAAPCTQTASGYSPFRAYYVPVARTWSPGDVVELGFGMPVAVRRPHPRVKSERGKIALTRGPLVYCLESIDNPGVDLFAERIDPSSLRSEFEPDLLGDLWVLRGQTVRGKAITAIPYFAWANRGPSQMTVYVRD